MRMEVRQQFVRERATVIQKVLLVGHLVHWSFNCWDCGDAVRWRIRKVPPFASCIDEARYEYGYHSGGRLGPKIRVASTRSISSSTLRDDLKSVKNSCLAQSLASTRLLSSIATSYIPSERSLCQSLG